MGKASKWLKGLLTGKKENEKDRITSHPPPPPPRETRSAPTLLPVPKEKRRWSFRRPAAGAGKDLSSPDPLAFPESDTDQKRHAMAVAVATAAAADAAVAAAQAAAAVVRLTTTSANPRTTAVDVAAAIRIQAVFRSYLARKALRALKGLVKLQALARGHLVRKQATATLRCMQALVTVQARARAQRIRTLAEPQPSPQRPLAHRRSPQHSRFRQSYDMERSVDEGVKIVEMDLGYSIAQDERTDHRFSTYSGSRSHPRLEPYQQLSPAPSALTDMSLGACSGHFEDFSFNTAQSSPHYFSATSMPDATKADFIASRHEGAYPMSAGDYPFMPNYMAKTESSRAKARSQSAPKQRPDSSERPPSRRRPSLEGRNIPRSSVRMQRSSSLVGASANEYQYPWSIKLDKSNMSIKDSECGSTSTVLTNTNYSRSLVSIQVHGNR